ncbi:MAG: hypothetical protein A3A98_01745 [Candidatus Staskawiczbacteria bacterium RIFCSPLOWO2_01_FULL_40_39]|uniref:Serine protease n=1 Tax=Candidatus Staskawiczbacteria bacterium RIFCSPHIGHO2_01_FULL_39_25 TaxID=1802202 RepID=A0A1G2HQD4_9BACT|nr:MAG: hypothetical protein A2730_01900 [Candidatus Staskawiczbacteria bacterium RIFCSPHIGHO2_01_FULL_39_25]OGZ72695.1 MAG: hypothetical protein A3A98_01745 [Candidatus Staskawiczbacteria bacterium RIFCSPLOWO2_01_FULL_40_39]OGZ75549.1 MAG: hypothetical protein A3I87_02665 [Candidatus Staskawiczbacteria bacterium RIFCSPLOWO2_02_FULL_39_8]
MNQKGFIQIPVLVSIIVGVLILGSGGYFGVKQYRNYQLERIEKEKIYQTEKETQQQKDLEVEKLKKEVEELKNKKPEVVQQTIVKEVIVPKTEMDLPSIIKQWRPRIVYIVCEWRYSDTGEVYAQGSGSGLLFAKSKDNLALLVMTNKHVLADGQYVASSCDISFPSLNETFKVSTNSLMESVSGLDWGLIRFQSSNGYLNSLVVSGPIESYPSVCKKPALVGDEIVILGYPGIGSQSDITATEGIISGRDGDYYITSAKIDRGNSGGAAISLKDNCYLGIPSFAQVGQIESLGRILDIEAVYK